MDENMVNKIKIITIISSIGFLPLFFIGITLLIVILFMADFESLGSGGNGNLSYDSGCNYEETMVTVMDVSNTKILATISLEDYVIGCAVYEIGASNGAYSTLNENYVKAQYIASKTWLLSTKSYNSSTKSITVKASTADQQWCDLKKGCYDVNYGSGLIATFPGGYNGKSAERILTEEDLETAKKYYSDTYGELFLPNDYNQAVSSLNSKTATYYVSTTQDFWRNQAKNGKGYEEILKLTGTTPGNPGAGYNTGLTNSDISTYYANRSIYRLGNYCAAKSNTNASVNYVKWMIELAANDKHGYWMDSRYRLMNPDVDCSSFVYYALINNGFSKTKLGSYPFTTSTMGEKLISVGFEKIPFNKDNLKEGDILWRSGHTEVYIGDNKNVGAHSNYDKKHGDSSGEEVDIGNTGSNWTYVYRLK